MTTCLSTYICDSFYCTEFNRAQACTSYYKPYPWPHAVVSIWYILRSTISYVYVGFNKCCIGLINHCVRLSNFCIWLRNSYACLRISYKGYEFYFSIVGMNATANKYVVAPGLLNVNAHFVLLDEAPVSVYCAYLYD